MHGEGGLKQRGRRERDDGEIRGAKRCKVMRGEAGDGVSCRSFQIK